MRKLNVVVTLLASSALALAAPAPALARPQAKAPTVTVLTRSVVLPANLAVSHGRVLVADGGTSTVSRLTGSKLTKVVAGPAASKGGDVAGIDISRDGRSYAYTTSTAKGFVHTSATLRIVGPGKTRVTADLAKYEATRNPDKARHYGVTNPSDCVKKAFAALKDGPPVSYRGLVDSHPYAVAATHHGWVVADAGGNDLLKVDSRGRISTLAVLPRQPLKITQKIATGLKLPVCAVGVTYNFEAVPTDVEVGPDGQLYVSILAGGPESPIFGARSRIYRVNPCNGAVKLIGDHFSGATNLAVGRHGRVYVAELFGNRISTLENGRPKTYVALKRALSVEVGPGGTLWAGTSVSMGGPAEPGSIVKIS